MSQEELYHTLLSLSTDRKTGRLVISGTSGASTNFGTFELKDGELVRATYLSHTGEDAVAAMLAADISEMRFMSAAVNSSEHPGISSVATCLQRLQSAQTEQQATQELGDDFKKEVITIMEKFYGAGAEKKVNVLAEEIPPRERPVEFLDKCKEYVEQMCGKKLADQMFARLYEKAEIE